MYDSWFWIVLWGLFWIAPFYRSSDYGNQALIAGLLSTVIKSADLHEGSKTILPCLSGEFQSSLDRLFDCWDQFHFVWSV